MGAIDSWSGPRGRSWSAAGHIGHVMSVSPTGEPTVRTTQPGEPLLGLDPEADDIGGELLPLEREAAALEGGVQAGIRGGLG